MARAEEKEVAAQVPIFHFFIFVFPLIIFFFILSLYVFFFLPYVRAAVEEEDAWPLLV